MAQIISLLTNYASQYIVALEVLLSTIWFLPIIDGLTLGPILLFFMIMGFAFSIFKYYVGGDD